MFDPPSYPSPEHASEEVPEQTHAFSLRRRREVLRVFRAAGHQLVDAVVGVVHAEEPDLLWADAIAYQRVEGLCRLKVINALESDL